jgi:hypothetical protein
VVSQILRTRRLGRSAVRRAHADRGRGLRAVTPSGRARSARLRRWRWRRPEDSAEGLRYHGRSAAAVRWTRHPGARTRRR